MHPVYDEVEVEWLQHSFVESVRHGAVALDPCMQGSFVWFNEEDLAAALVPLLLVPERLSEVSLVLKVVDSEFLVENKFRLQGVRWSKDMGWQQPRVVYQDDDIGQGNEEAELLGLVDVPDGVDDELLALGIEADELNDDEQSEFSVGSAEEGEASGSDEQDDEELEEVVESRFHRICREQGVIDLGPRVTCADSGVVLGKFTYTQGEHGFNLRAKCEAHGCSLFMAARNDDSEQLGRIMQWLKHGQHCNHDDHMKQAGEIKTFLKRVRVPPSGA